MDLTQAAIEEVVHPTAAFLRVSRVAGHVSPHQQPDWKDSELNPKNRIDSLDFPERPLWRVDGCTGLGTQYYTVPVCLLRVPPMRMDVFIPENQPPYIRDQLDLHKAFHTKDGPRVQRLAITRHIIRTLQHWTTSTFETLGEFERFYRSLPFGSRLVLENLSLDIRQIDVKVGKNHNLEVQLLSLPSLTRLWGQQFPFLKVIDILDVHVVSVLHDSVCLVRILGELFIFKALVSDFRYLYHELKLLCTLEPHENVIGRPIHLVKKVCNFGGKNAIIGFTTFYHAQGSLRDFLPRLRIHNQLQRSQQFKWSIQITQALEHLRARSSTYYSDLRLDNIVLSKSLDVVMVDFEQRGVWCEFAAPEVNAIEYMRLIAVDERTEDEVKSKYLEIMKQLVPAFEELQETRYTNPSDGYNATWIALDPEEQEAAEVYMLGRVLWCIFEGVSGPQKAAVWQSYRWESDLEFPDYDRTPPRMRKLIDHCTRGRRPTLGSLITRQTSRLVPRYPVNDGNEAEQVSRIAKAFWVAELDWAENFVHTRFYLQDQGLWRNNFYDRPTIREALDYLLKMVDT
ncbi:hypothetical protein F5Y16DRAFT_91288 [Xylariaceae sp. FL0255]|nr:hypothetical protein F5Y16DRAFT_91288 [Xylariaceae sp. FL0255]